MIIYMSNETRNFCFLKGELVDCIPGRVQDCNMKQVRSCIMDEQKIVQDKIKKANGFCFYKGELVVQCRKNTGLQYEAIA